MSTRFFASVRQNQRQWMVVLTILSLVSFLFLDDFGRGKGPMSPLGGGLLIGCLCAAGLSIIGYSRGLTAEFGAGGFVVGFLAGYLGFGAIGANKPIVRTSIGNFSQADLIHLSRERQKANQFVFSISRKTQNPQMGFGGADEDSIIQHEMLLADARKMGIQVSDERVNEYLKQISQGRLTRQDFKDSLREAKLGEGEMFELLKTELAANLVVELTSPPAYVPPIAPGFERFINPQESPRYMQETPYQLWTSFEMLNVKESLQAVAIPAKEFVSKVVDPSDSELSAFYEQYKNRRWIDESRPGFAKMPRVQLAYLSADFEKFEAGADPTDAEVQEYFDKNKDRYRAPLPKESTAPQLPDGDANPPKSETPAEQPPKTDDSEKPKEPEPKSDPAPAVEDKKPAEGDVKKDAPAEPKSNCGEEATATEKPADKPAEAKEAAADPKPESTAAVEPAAEKPAEPTDAKPKDEDAPIVPSLNASPESLPAPKYREMNDDLKLEIREAILRERAYARITAELDKAYDEMVKLGLDYDTTTDAAQKADKAKSVAEQLKEYAQAHKLEYKETPEITFEELSAEPIGSSTEGKSSATVANDVFMQSATGDARLPLYAPRRADSKSRNAAFAYWKIAEFPAEASDLKEDAVRAKVALAWKFDQSRPLAEKRAQELMAKVKAEGNDLPAALSTETVTGDKNDPTITVIATDEFSWLTTGRSVPGGAQNPTISTIPLIDNIGYAFMKTVFEDLKDGEVGMAPDEPRSVFYIVKVLNRDTARPDDGGVEKHERQQRFLKEEFASRLFPLIKSPYQALAQLPQQQIDMLWRQNFGQNHSVDWDSDPESAPRQRPRQRR